MTDFFLLATAVFAAVVLVRVLTQHWPRTSDETEEVDIGR
jgi:hypothetical protein|tara:strand:- start:1546 stop:1665 length:120 start_codon:yes stop_codon:yes gene_type:complete